MKLKKLSSKASLLDSLNLGFSFFKLQTIRFSEPEIFFLRITTSFLLLFFNVSYDMPYLK